MTVTINDPCRECPICGGRVCHAQVHLTFTDRERAAVLIAENARMRDALENVEAVMSIVAPRGSMKEYLAALAQVRAALAEGPGDAVPTIGGEG